MSFSTLGLSPELISQSGYSEPTPVQVEAIPLLLSGRDLLACAQTGTGKTGAFALPLVQQLLLSENEDKQANAPRVLVLTPTRELAIQVGEAFKLFIGEKPLTVAMVYGGVNISPQRKLLAQGVDILIATPGRLFDLMYQEYVSLSQVEYLVIDEADRMLDMGFVKDIQRVKRNLPLEHQSAMFSATLTPDIATLAKTMLFEPAQVNLEANTANQQITQRGVLLDPRRKSEYLAEMIGKQNLKQVLVFTGSKQLADQVLRELQLDGIACAVLHGDRTQARRSQALEDFKSGAIRALVATDVAARGLDIAALPLVVNFDLPMNPEDYLHRIGRTGRAGQTGEALTLLSPSERLAFKAIEAHMGEKLNISHAEGYEPGAPLPARYEMMDSKGSASTGNGYKKRHVSDRHKASGRGTSQRGSQKGGAKSGANRKSGANGKSGVQGWKR